MINLDADSRLARWFVWSCDQLPFTVTHNYDEDGKDLGRRKGASYIANGSTLCHIVWAVLWVPIAAAAFSGFFIFMFVALHFSIHSDFAMSNPNIGPLANFAAYFIPEGLALGTAALVGIIILSLIGGSKVGFFKLLWQYLRGIKQRVCPLVHFDGVVKTTITGA